MAESLHTIRAASCGLERFKIMFQFLNRVVEIDIVGLKEGMHLRLLVHAEEGPGLKPLVWAADLPRAEAHCYSERQEAESFWRLLKPIATPARDGNLSG